MPSTEKRTDYRHFLAIPTRWMDNDIYGHVNNVVYYSYFDTVVNEYLIREGGLDIATGATIGLAVETFCQFHQPLTFPEVIDAGLRVGKLGSSSVRYEIGLFRMGQAEPAAIPRQPVEKRVRRRVVGLAGRARDRGHRTAKHEEVEGQLARLNVEVPGAARLGP